MKVDRFRGCLQVYNKKLRHDISEEIPLLLFRRAAQEDVLKISTKIPRTRIYTYLSFW